MAFISIWYDSSQDVQLLPLWSKRKSYWFCIPIYIQLMLPFKQFNKSQTPLFIIKFDSCFIALYYNSKLLLLIACNNISGSFSAHKPYSNSCRYAWWSRKPSSLILIFLMMHLQPLGKAIGQTRSPRVGSTWHVTSDTSCSRFTWFWWTSPKTTGI